MFKILAILLIFLRLEYVVASTNQTMLFSYVRRGDNNNGINNYRHTLTNLLRTFSSQSTNKEFYNSTSFSRSSDNNLYGFYLCRGDIDRESCRACIKYARESIIAKLPYGIEAGIWYEYCMLRYSNKPFFGKYDVNNNMMSSTWSFDNITGNPAQFVRILRNTVNLVAVQAANGRQAKKFATKIVKFTEDESLYALAQCTPDLTSSDCNKCLRNSIGHIRRMGASRGGSVMHLNCMVRYEMFPFFYNDKIKSLESSTRANVNSTEIRLRVRLEPLPLYNNSVIKSTSTSVMADSPMTFKFTGRVETSPFGNRTLKGTLCFRPMVPSNSTTLLEHNGSDFGARSDAI